MIIALDTNRYRDLCEGVPEVVETLRRAEQVSLPLPVLAELRSGFACGSKGRKNEAVLNRFLNEPRVRITAPDDQTCFFYARIFRHLRDQGTPIPVNDLWIAAIVDQHHQVLYTRDAHFQHVPQLALLN